MSDIQNSITSILREKSLRHHVTAAAIMIAIATIFIVAWSLHINGQAQTAAEIVCGVDEHVHTTACYDWVPLDSSEEAESVTEDTETEESTESAAEGTTEAAQPGDTKVVDGVTYVYTTVCGMEEHTHTGECYASEATAGNATEADTKTGEESEDTAVLAEETETDGSSDSKEENSQTDDDSEDGSSEADTDNDSENSSSETSSEGLIVGFVQSLFSGGNEEEDSEEVSEGETADANSGIATTSLGEDESETTTMTLTSSSSSALDATTSSEGTYYVADAVKLADVDTTGATDYIIYTVIGSNYYVLDANGRLRKVNSISSGSGISWTADDNLGYYLWNLISVDGADGTYTVYNSSYNKYFVPESKSVSGTDNDATIQEGFSSKTGSLTFQGDFELTYTFTNTGCVGLDDGNNGENWFNYIIEMVGDGTYLDVRADNYGWIVPNGGSTIVPSEELSTSSDSIVVGVGSSNWTDWLTAMKSGSSIEVNIKKTGTSVTVSATANNTTFTATAYVKEYTDDVPVTVYLTGEYCSLTNVEYTYKGVTCAEGTDGDVTIETYLGGSTGELEFTGNFVLNYSFHNKGSGSNNWDNYILKLKNASEVALTMRSDNYGWTDNATSSSVVFGDGSADWTGWLANMKDADVSVQIIRNGGTVTVTATAAGDTFTMVAYVSDFEDTALTVWLTGEACLLSDVSYNYYELSNARTSETSGNTVITLESETDAYAWTANASVLSDSYILRSQNSTGYVEWVNSDEEYLQVCDSSTASELKFYFAEVRTLTAYFDGSNGNLYSSYHGSTYRDDLRSTVVTYEMDKSGTAFYVDVPTVTMSDWSASTARANLTLAGWFDIYNNVYYELNSIVQIPYDENLDLTVCYADWVAENYNGGASNDTYYNNEALETKEFITTQVFDYNELINLYSAALTEKAESASKYAFGTSETWTVSYSGNSYKNVLGNAGWGFLFINSSASTKLQLPLDRNIVYTNGGGEINSSNDKGATTGILTSDVIQYAGNVIASGSTFADGLLGKLFDTDTSLFGKLYLGTGDYLYQYDTASGYYYFDSDQNAAFYNRNDGRFYLYDYKVAVDSTNSNTGEYTSDGDFFPFSYAEVQSLGVSSNGTTRIAAANVDYYFGMSSEITFYLPQNSGEQNGNQTDNEDYSDMVFKFSGDDDVWVVLDYGTSSEQLLLDIGGVHGKVYGEINFSTGKVRVVNTPTSTFTNANTGDTETIVIYDDNDIIGINENYTGSELVTETTLSTILSGTHTLTIFYLERGASQSNAAIYFNISSATYNLDLSKVDEDGNALSGAKFTFYDESGNEANLATTQGGNATTSTFASDEIAYGLREGVTYTVRETTEPSGYTASGKYFTVCLKHRVLTITVYSSGGSVLEEHSYTCTLGTYDSSAKTYNYSSTTSSDTSSNTTSWSYVKFDSSSYMKPVVSGATVAYYQIGFTVVNTDAYELPSTGSTGIFPYQKTGTLLVSGAVVELIAIAFYEFERMRKLRTEVNKEAITVKSAGCTHSGVKPRWHPREQRKEHGHSRDRPGG